MWWVSRCLQRSLPLAPSSTFPKTSLTCKQIHDIRSVFRTWLPKLHRRVDRLCLPQKLAGCYLLTGNCLVAFLSKRLERFACSKRRHSWIVLVLLSTSKKWSIIIFSVPEYSLGLRCERTRHWRKDRTDILLLVFGLPLCLFMLEELARRLGFDLMPIVVKTGGLHQGLICL